MVDTGDPLMKRFVSMESIAKNDTSHGPMLDGELLAAFVAVVENGSFTGAARQLHKTQSTVSARVHTLEERLQARLLERTSRHVALTQNGETFLVYARRILQLQREVAGVLGESGAGVIRFGIPENYAEAWLPALLERFNRLHPAVRLHIHCRMSRELVEALAEGHLDLALTVSYEPRPTGEALAREELVWAAHRSFRRDDRNALPLALFPDDCPYRRRALTALTHTGHQWTLEYTSQSPTGLRVTVDQGNAVTVTDRRTLPDHWRALGPADGLPALPPTDLELHRSPSFQHPAGDDLAALLRELVAAYPR